MPVEPNLSTTLLDRRAVGVSILPVPVVTGVVMAGLAPIVLLAAPIIVAPLVAAVLGVNEDPWFDGAAAAILATVLVWLTAIVWFPLVGPELPGWMIADITYVSIIIGIPVAIGAVIFAAALGAVLARAADVAVSIAGGDVRVEFR